MWDRLTPGDIERVKAEVGERRAEILARHAEELEGLDNDQVFVKTLEQAIKTFVQKFNRSSAADAIVTPRGEPEWLVALQQGRG